MFCSTMSDSFYYGQDSATSSTMKSTTEPQEELVLYIPEMEEIRISPIVARKGFLNILEQKSNGWKKRWVVSIRVFGSLENEPIEQNLSYVLISKQVVRRPYVFIFRDEKDPVERALINLTTAQVDYSEHQLEMVKVPNSFR